MRTNIFLFALAVMAIVPVGFVSAHSGQTSALRINENTALYTITYEFQAGNDPYFLPILTQNGLPYASKSPFVGYTAVQDGAMVPTGYTSAGMVLSDLPIENGKYRIEPLKKGSVTLVTLLKKTSTGGADVGLQITNIPYYKGSRREVVDEADLEHFSTHAVLLGRAEPDCACGT